MTCKKVLIYINITYDGWIIEILSSGSHFIECSIVHIFDNHIILSHLHDYTNMAICRRKSRTMIDDDCARFWRVACWYALLSGIFEPIFCISSPGDIFIFRNKARTIPPDKTTTTTVYLEIERIPTICNRLTNIWFIFFRNSCFLFYWFSLNSILDRFFLYRRNNSDFFGWIFCGIWEE